MENQELMIRVQDVKKQYRLGQIGGGTLRGDLQSWWARKRGKEDPNTVIGTDAQLRYVITDKDVTIGAGAVLNGAAHHPFVLAKGSTV